MSSGSRLFISRALKDDSPLLAAYPRDAHEWTDVSLLAFEPIDHDTPESDWLFFYSPRGVDFFYKNEKSENRSYKVICYGPGTARHYQQVTGLSPEVIGTGDSSNTLPMLLDAVGDESICFVRGRQSVRAIQQLLLDSVRATEVIVYDTTLRSDVELSHYDYALITSPLSYRAFLSNGGSADIIVAIGATTKAAIKQMSPSQTVKRASEPSEASMLNAMTSPR